MAGLGRCAERPKNLSNNAFEKAAQFLRASARPLEVSRFENIFNGSEIADVLIELDKFQNSDGGFGHALEPDLRAPESSALCTSIALQIMRDHNVSRDEEIVRRAVCYLMDTLDRSELHWRITPESAGAAPHAPWWNQEGREDEFRGFSLNPTAEILGYLLDYGEPVVAEYMILQITDRIVDSLRSSKVVEMHDILCCLRLLETERLPLGLRENIQHELMRLITDAVAPSPEQWGGYSLRPLKVVRRPGSPFVERFREAVSLNLDFEIEEQKDSGAWLP